MECMYCGAYVINAEMFVVREASKPKGAPHRWRQIGFCCEDCEQAGYPTDIEFKRPTPTHSSEAGDDGR